MNAIREDQLGRAMTWSLIVHGAIVLFIVVKSLVFPGDPVLIAPALRVDIVGLPDLLKKDLLDVSKIIPKAAAPEKRAEPAKELPKEKVAPPVEVAKPDEMVLNAKKAEKKAKEANLEKTKKIDAALAKIRALERLKDRADENEKEEDDDAVIIKGNQISKGTSLSGEAREKAQAGYYDLIREALVQHWALPPWLARQKLAAQVQIRIDGAGNVLASRFLKTSGNKQFDDAILGTIRDAQPLPRPPKELISSLTDSGVVVGFPL